MPITWRNRRSGISKLKIKEMGSRYLFITLYCWLESISAGGLYAGEMRCKGPGYPLCNSARCGKGNTKLSGGSYRAQ